MFCKRCVGVSRLADTRRREARGSRYRRCRRGRRRKKRIQAKRYGPSTTVGSPEVQQYVSLRIQEDNVNQVTIVTTGEFSQQPRDLAPGLDVILDKETRK